MLTTIQNVCLIIIGICFLAILINVIRGKSLQNWVDAIALTTIVICLIVGTISEFIEGQYHPKEFPSEKYELKYKVTDIEGQIDTTYLIIKKKF